MDAFFARASPELTRLVSANEGDQFFASFKKLGHLKHCDPAVGQSVSSAVLGKGRMTGAHYEAAAQFEKGDARIVLDLVKRGDQWQFQGFHVNSPLFIAK